MCVLYYIQMHSLKKQRLNSDGTKFLIFYLCSAGSWWRLADCKRQLFQEIEMLVMAKSHHWPYQNLKVGCWLLAPIDLGSLFLLEFKSIQPYIMLITLSRHRTVHKFPCISQFLYLKLSKSRGCQNLNQGPDIKIIFSGTWAESTRQYNQARVHFLTFSPSLIPPKWYYDEV